MTKTIAPIAHAATVCLCLAGTAAWAQIPRPQDPKTPPVSKPGPVPKPGQPGDVPTSAAKEGQFSATDQAFIKKAAEGGQAEVTLAKLAQERASNEKVKAYAQRLERDHSQANEELRSLAAQKSVTLPSEGQTPIPKQKKLESLKGAAFDTAYIDAMIADHKKDIAEFERHASKGSDPDLKAFAQKMLPTLREHLKEAQDTRQTLGSPSS
jgi:putative membrane protein